MIGLIYAGGGFAADSWRIGEHSTVTAEGPPVYHFKTFIPIGGAFVMLQGLAEIARCIACPSTGPSVRASSSDVVRTAGLLW